MPLQNNCLELSLGLEAPLIRNLEVDVGVLHIVIHLDRIQAQLRAGLEELEAAGVNN